MRGRQKARACERERKRERESERERKAEKLKEREHSGVVKSKGMRETWREMERESESARV